MKEMRYAETFCTSNYNYILPQISRVDFEYFLKQKSTSVSNSSMFQIPCIFEQICRPR